MKRLAISGLLVLLLAGCAHKQGTVWPFITETCPAKALLRKGEAKCRIGADGRKMCDNVEVKESCVAVEKGKGGK